MALSPDDQFPLPLSDYSRAKVVYTFQRALAKGDVEMVERLERLGDHDVELRQSLQAARAQFEPPLEEEGNLLP